MTEPSSSSKHDNTKQGLKNLTSIKQKQEDQSNQMEVEEIVKDGNQIDDKKMNFMTSNKKIPKTKKNEKVKADKKTKNITPIPSENKRNDKRPAIIDLSDIESEPNIIELSDSDDVQIMDQMDVSDEAKPVPHGNPTEQITNR